MGVKIEDVAFWILIALAVFVALWKLVGSPTNTATLISITLFVAGSEILLWRALFSMDKKVTIGFIKMKNDMNDKFSQMDNKLNNIESLIKGKK